MQAAVGLMHLTPNSQTDYLLSLQSRSSLDSLTLTIPELVLIPMIEYIYSYISGTA